MNLRKVISAIALCAAFSATALRFGNEATDTTRINDMLVDLVARNFASPSERTAYTAKKFVGTPYAAHTLEGTPEQLSASTDPYVRQFLDGEPDGPVAFHYPADPIEKEFGVRA